MSFDESEYDLDSQAEDALGSLANEEAAAAAAAIQSEQVLHQAVQRIEEANLFKLLITQQVFAPGSANPQILASVNNKIKQFAIQELELLLGLTQKPNPKHDAPKQFDEDEEQALKILASKVLKREVKQTIISEKKAELQPIGTLVKQNEVAPSMNNIISSPKPAINKSTTPAPTHKDLVETPKKRKMPGKRGTAKPVGVKPLPMPTAEEFMMKTGMAQPKANFTDTSVPMGGASSLESVISQLTGGNLVHNAGGASDEGDDVNDRF